MSDKPREWELTIDPATGEIRRHSTVCMGDVQVIVVEKSAYTQERERADRQATIIAQSEQKLGDQATLIARLEAENKVLSERFVSKTEYDALEAELAEANRRGSAMGLLAEIDRLQAEVAELRAELSDYSAAIISHRERMGEIAKERDQLRALCDRLAEALKNISPKIQQWDGGLGDMHKVDAALAEYERLRGKG